MCLFMVLFFSVFSLMYLNVQTASMALPGQVNPDNEGVRDAANFATVYYNQRSGDKYIYKVVEILDAEVQIDKGLLYTMDVVLGRTHCLNGKTPDLESCVLFRSSEEAKSLKCHFVVLCNPLLEEKQLVESTCSPASQRTIS